MYVYLLKNEQKNEIYQLPIPPDNMITKSSSINKTYKTLNLGEINVLNGIGLREISMKILLPNDLSLPFVQAKYSNNCIIGKPIIYLSKFREFKVDKNVLRLIVTRVLPNGDEIFKGDMKVSLEDYIVYENAGEEGDFWVELKFKECIDIKEKKLMPIDIKKQTYSYNTERKTKEVNKTYVVKSGDTLWKIAKTQLNDETKYKQIMQINNITEPKKLKVGMVLKLS